MKNTHSKLRTNYQEGFTTGNGYWLRLPYARSNYYTTFHLRFTLTQTGVVQTIYQIGLMNPTSPGFFALEVTAANLLRLRTKNHVGGYLDVSLSVGTVSAGVPYTLTMFIDGTIYWCGQYVTSATFQPNDGGSGWQPRFLGRDYLGNTFPIIYHEFIPMSLSLSSLSVSRATIAMSWQLPAALIFKATDLLAKYTFSKTNWMSNYSFVDSICPGTADKVYIGGGLEQNNIIGQQYRFAQVTNSGVINMGGMVPPITTSLMKNRWYPESIHNEVYGLNLTGKLSLYNDTNTFPTLGTTMQASSLDLRYNKMGGTASATDVAVSDVYVPARTQVYVGSQSPVGTHSLRWRQEVNMLYFDILNGKYSFFNINTTTATFITIDTLSLGNNQLNQTFSQLYDPAKVKVKSFSASSVGTNLTGQIVLSDISIYFLLQFAGVTGAIPRPPDSHIGGFDVYACVGLTTLPADFNNTSYLVLANTAVTNGVIIANKCSNFQIQNRVGAGSNIGVDLSNNIMSPINLTAQGANLNLLKLPTKPNTTFSNFTVDTYSTSTSLIDFSFVTWTMFTQGMSFSIQSGYGLNQVFPLGSVICSNFIRLQGCGFSQTNLDTTIDNFINNAYVAPTGFQGFDMTTNLKNLIYSNNGATPYPTLTTARYDSLRGICKNRGWLMWLPLSTEASTQPGATTTRFIRIKSFVPTIGYSDRLTLVIDNAGGLANSALFQITNTTAYNGSIRTATGYTWQLLARGSTEADALSRSVLDGNQGAVLIITKPGLNTAGMTTETGVIEGYSYG